MNNFNWELEHLEKKAQRRRCEISSSCKMEMSFSEQRGKEHRAGRAQAKNQIYMIGG